MPIKIAVNNANLTHITGGWQLLRNCLCFTDVDSLFYRKSLFLKSLKKIMNIHRLGQ